VPGYQVHDRTAQPLTRADIARFRAASGVTFSINGDQHRTQLAVTCERVVDDRWYELRTRYLVGSSVRTFHRTGGDQVR
jgi:hypothetical protein